MSTGFLFPGQGSQKLGMLADIPEMYMERLENVTGYRLVDKEENYQIDDETSYEYDDM